MISKNKKKVFISLLTLFLGVGLFFLVAPAYADGPSDWAGKVLGGLIGWIIGALGIILVLVMQALVSVAQYSNFIGAPAIMHGWKIVRDICNMFFVLVLLIIAFATILKIENYSYKKWLPKLILMAILINFSKTICGLLIDFAQVVMLTFVNAFKDMAAGNLVSNLGITDILTLANNSADVGFWAIVGAYVLGLIYVLIALVVIVTMLAMLVMRIVMIWIYVVLSPAAYLMSAFPGGQKYASQWWSEFSKNLIVGPVLAFFIWLSFVSLQTQDMKKDFPVTGPTDTKGIAEQAGISGQTDTTSAIGATNASTPDVFIRFIIAIGMLIGGLKISQEIGGAAGGIAGKGMGKISSGAAFAGGAIGGYALGKAKSAGRSVRNQSLGVASLLTKGAGMGINKVAGKNTQIGDTLKATGGIGIQWREDMQTSNKKRKVEKRQKFLEKMGMGEKTMDKTSEYLKTDAGKNMTNITGAMGTGATLGAAGFGLPGAAAGAGIGLVVSAVQSVMPKFGKYLNKKGEEQKNKGNNIRGEALDFLGKQASGVHSLTTETTQKAAASGSKSIETARRRVDLIASNPRAILDDDGLAPSTFSSKEGINQDQKKLFEQLTNPEHPKSGNAVANLETMVGGVNIGNDKERSRVEAIARGIAAFKKGGGDTSSLNGLIAAVDAKNAQSNTPIGTVSDLESKMIAYRKTGVSGEQGSGELAVNTFANNKDNVAGKNVVGVDFNKMEGSGLDVKAEASFASGDAMGPIVDALKNQINSERANLVTQKNEGAISDEDFSSRNLDLDKSEARLNDPVQLKNLNLVNTASANYGRQEKMASVYHEEIHEGGVEDENMTEGISKKLMENKLYGRNAASGGRHATEIAQKVKSMKDDGRSDTDIMAEVDSEIKSRLSAEGKSRAQRVANLESGKKETESEATATKSKEVSEDPNVNTETLQKSLDTLTEKIKKMTSSVKPISGGKGGAGGSDLLFPLKQLNLNMRKNVSALKTLSKKTGGQGPTTIMEASAINDETSS